MDSLPDDYDDVGECAHCGGMALWFDCPDCAGEGYRDGDDLMAEDPLWYDEDDTETCHTCNGIGGWWLCAEHCEASNVAV